MDASYVDLADPSHLEFDYMRWMRIVLRAARARRVLHVGGGACALARALAAENSDPRAQTAPTSLQEVCEVNPEVLAVARAHFGLRRTRGLRVRVAEGRSWVARQPDASWDAIALDAFVAATVPRHLITVEALADAARVAPLVLVNVLDDRSARDVRLIAAALAEAYPHVWGLGGRTGNTILAGAARRLDLDRIATRAAADPSPARLTGPAEMARLVAGMSPLRDEKVSTG